MQWLTPVIIVFLFLIVSGFVIYFIRREDPGKVEQDLSIPADSDKHDDVVDGPELNHDGYEFIAHLRLSTPLEILEHHYEKHPGPRRLLPKYGSILYGSWMLTLQSWEDVFASDNFQKNDDIQNEYAFSESETLESDIGVMPVDGGLYLEFLKAFRSIVESDSDPEQKKGAVYSLAIINDDYRRFINKHVEEDQDWLDPYLGYEKWLKLDKNMVSVAKELYESGYRTIDDVRKASDGELCAINGVSIDEVMEIRELHKQ